MDGWLGGGRFGGIDVMGSAVQTGWLNGGRSVD